MSADTRAGAAAPRTAMGARRWPVHIVVPLAVAIAIGAILLITGREALTPATPVTVRPAVFAQSAPVETRRAQSGATPEARRSVPTVQAPGWLEPDPFYIACTALAEGVVDEMLVLEGERIEAGQVVARLVDDDARLDLIETESALSTARAELALAEADLEAAQTDWDEPVERERAEAVAEAALAETVAELEQLPSLISVLGSELTGMREELSRAEAALERAGVADIEVILLRADAEAKAAEVESLRRKEGILIAKRMRQEAELRAARRAYELRVAEKRMLDSARANLERARARVAFAEAHRDEARLRLDRMTIRAPISGLVQRRIKGPGDKVMFGMDTEHSMHLVHLYDPERIQVRVDVPLADAAKVYVGQACEVVVDVLPEEPFRGEVTRITHEADLQKNTLEVKVRVIDPKPILKPEMLTRVKFLGTDERGERTSEAPGDAPGAPERASVRVPVECLVDGSEVWLVKERKGAVGRAAPRRVEVGPTEGGFALVTGPIRPGDLLIVSGPPLVEGQRVRITGAGGRSAS